MDANVLSPTSFLHLCRSSPWRWQSLRFEAHQMLPESNTDQAEISRHPVADLLPPTMNWLRRPGALRVETLEGQVLFRSLKVNESKELLFISGNRKSWLLAPGLTYPVYDDDGLVMRRPEALYGEPSYGDARFAAALDPVELAGSEPIPLERWPFGNPAKIEDLAMIEHQGRPCVEAVLTPNYSYQPTFKDAPLLFPGRTAVLIDLGTGICVASQSLDGPTRGAGHWLVLHGIDEYMLDDLFAEVSMGLSDVRAHIPWNLDPQHE